MNRSVWKGRGMGMLFLMAPHVFLAWGVTPVHAEDRVVVIPLMEAPVASSPAPVPKTGQTTCWDVSGNKISCSGTGQDGDLQKGAAWPTPRFSDNPNGTVTDHLTGLVWLKNAKCTKFYSDDLKNENLRTWDEALDSANKLAAPYCGLTDGSKAGDWRLPNLKELESLIDFGQSSPALPLDCPLRNSTAGTSYYWSATTVVSEPGKAWYVYVNGGGGNLGIVKTAKYYVLAVRGGQ